MALSKPQMQQLVKAKHFPRSRWHNTETLAAQVATRSLPSNQELLATPPFPTTVADGQVQKSICRFFSRGKCVREACCYLCLSVDEAKDVQKQRRRDRQRARPRRSQRFADTDADDTSDAIADSQVTSEPEGLQLQSCRHQRFRGGCRSFHRRCHQRLWKWRGRCCAEAA